MPEEFDREIELAQYFGQDPKERIDELTRLQPVREGSKLTNDPLQIALAKHSKGIELIGAVEQERKSWALVRQAEKHLADCMEHWEACQQRMWEIKPHVSDELWNSVYYGEKKADA